MYSNVFYRIITSKYIKLDFNKVQFQPTSGSETFPLVERLGYKEKRFPVWMTMKSVMGE